MELKEKVIEVIDDFKEKKTVSGLKSFVDQTLYVALDDELNATPSKNISVIDNAKEVLLILVSSELAYTRWHNWYVLKHIDARGNVNDGFRYNDLRISAHCAGKFVDQRLTLSLNGESLLYSIPYYYYGDPISRFRDVWEVFQFVKDLKSHEEIKWAVRFFTANRELVVAKEKLSFAEMQERFLQKQLDQLNQFVENIKDLISD